MKTRIIKSVLFSLLAILKPGFAKAVEIKTPQVPTVHVQAPHVTAPSSNGSIVTHRQGDTYTPVMKPPARKYNSISVNRGTTSNQSLQQWQQGVSGGDGKLHGPVLILAPETRSRP